MNEKKDETISKSEHERIISALHEEILRKDKLINKLKEENNILIKTALKRAEKIADMNEKLNDIKDSK